MGACAWVMYPRTQSPPAHPIPHLALGSSTSTTTRLDRRRAHPGTTTGTYLGQRGTEVHGPLPPTPRPPRLAASPPCFLGRRPRALGKYFCLVPGPVKSRPCRDHAVTAVQTPEVPLALVPGRAPAHPLLMPSLLPPLLPTCDRAWQAVAEH